MKKKKKNIVDPHAKREAQKYDNPVASRELILSVLDAATGPMTHPQLCKALQVISDDQQEALRRRLLAMERDGQIHSNRKQAYAQVDKLDLIPGRIQGHKDGFGFLLPFDNSGDIYLPYRQMRKVFNGDEALVRMAPASVKGRREGKIVEVLARNTTQVVGRYYSKRGVSFVKPDNPRITHDILIAAGDEGGARSDQFVTADITQYPDRQLPAMGKVTEVLGDHMAPGMEIDVAIRVHDLPHIWPDNVKQQAAGLPAEVDEGDKSGRVDLRHLPLVTIDGEDARDFDDAVYCEPKKSGGWRLYVAIADVSHYVTPASPLDQEAEVRSTSVYFPDFVLPMLPEALSNGLCSLNPHVDRLAMVCEMSISAAGRVSRYQFYEAVIHSHARLTYTKVGHMLSDEPEHVQARQTLRQEYAAVMPGVDELYQLYKVLRTMREQRGAIDFETTETRILFDEQRKIERIVPVVRNDAHKLIEECMLCANVCAARFLEKHELPGLYRVHEGPKEQKLENLRTFLNELGLNLLAKGKPQPEHYQNLVQAVANRPDAKVIQTVMLRSLSQAVYQPDNQGHFGLAYPAYTHFTSPIRRYPDLLTHRAIRHVIRSRKASTHVARVRGAGVIPKKAIYPYDIGDMVRLGEHTSTAERRADDASRDVVSWLKCEFLQAHIGDVFTGVITAVTNFGVFVELLDVYVEGLVHITALPSDYYHYEEAHHRLVGERTHQIFCLGDEVTVQVAAVNLDDRKVDLELVSVSQKASSLRRKKSKSRSVANTAVKKEDSVREKLRRGDFASLETPKAKAGAGKKRRGKATASSKKTGSAVTPKNKAAKKKPAKKKAAKKSAVNAKASIKKAPTKKATKKSAAKSTSTRTVRKRKARK